MKTYIDVAATCFTALLLVLLLVQVPVEVWDKIMPAVVIVLCLAIFKYFETKKEI